MTTTEVARFAGTSLRQLQWWDERGVVQPQQQEHSRIYTQEQAQAIRTIAVLRRKGLSLIQIRRIIKQIQRAKPGDILLYSGKLGAIVYAEQSVALANALRHNGSVVLVEI